MCEGWGAGGGGRQRHYVRSAVEAADACSVDRFLRCLAVGAVGGGGAGGGVYGCGGIAAVVRANRGKDMNVKDAPFFCFLFFGGGQAGVVYRTLAWSK